MSLSILGRHRMSTYASVVFVALWVGFAAALIVNREWLDVLWNWGLGLPLALKIIIWLIFAPIMVGLWIWESSWPVLGRLAGFAGMAAWTSLAVSSLVKAFR